MAQITSQTKIKDVQIGDTFVWAASKHGQFVNCTIIGIRTIKSGRIHLTYSHQYLSVDGKLSDVAISTIGHSPLSPDRLFHNY